MNGRAQEIASNALLWFDVCFAAVALAVMGALSHMNNQPADYDTMNRSTVMVEREGGHGSGVVVGERIVITAAHVAADIDTMTVVFLDGEKIDARVIWRGDATTLDIAMLELAEQAPVAAAKLACDDLAVNDRLVAFGNPGQGRWVSSELRVSSALRWQGDSDNTTVVQGPLIPGMSGGPVYNERGDVAGIIHAFYLMNLGYVPAPNGMSSIVPASALCNVLPAVRV